MPKNAALRAILDDPAIIEIREFLSLYTKRAYVVGGAVRDAIFSVATSSQNGGDFDIEIYDICAQRFDELMNELGAKPTGKSFFVYKYKNLDLALPRTESKTGYGHTGFTAQVVADELVASSRRDFTINTLMLDIFNGELLDLHNGLKDLQNGVLRITDARSFGEDSLRVLRGVQFAARFGLDADKKSICEMKKCDIGDLSPQRVVGELLKFFSAPKKLYGVKILRQTSLDERLFGVKIDEAFASLADKHFELSKASFKELIFLYDLINHYRVVPAILDILPNRFKRAFKEPFFDAPSDLELVLVAIKMPLKEWLGLNSNELISRAKRLKLYSEKFAPKIDLGALSCLKAKELGDEINSLKLAEAKKYLKSLK